MVELKYGVNDLDIPAMSKIQKEEFFETKNKFKTTIQNVICKCLDPIIYSKAWDYQFVKNPIGTCFNLYILYLCESFPGRVVNLEYCQKCKRLFWGCPKGHKFGVHWEVSYSGSGALYCESCRCNYSRFQVEIYHNKKEKEFQIEEKKKAEEYDEYLRKTTFIRAN